ncbi:MAG TPA: sialate O-acetylesterase [Prolixibacteraceae bacterium]|nr:sialate O-acetylesterase [Prolixibacteraceae bacterium]
MKHIYLFLFSAFLLLTSRAFSQDPDFHIYLCFGQSNMEGHPGTIQTQDMTVDSRFRVMEAVNCTNLGRKKGLWYTATPPLCRCYSGLTPADYFGRTMVANLPSNIRVGVINVSVAGCKIELFDKDNYSAYVSTVTADWLKNIINEYGGNPYGHLVEIAKLAQKDGVIKGILLHQGESNTGDSQWPAKVKRIYTHLMNDLALDPAKVPLLAGEVVNADQGGVCASMNSIIATLPKSLPNSYVISSKGCTDGTDNLHFNSAGYRELGKRYANKMLSLMGIIPTDVQEMPSLAADHYLLTQNIPNPFNGKTSMTFEIPGKNHVSLKVYNLSGTEIAELAGKEYPAGKHSVEFNAVNLPKGIYFYTIRAGKFTQSRKMVFQNE